MSGDRRGWVVHDLHGPVGALHRRTVTEPVGREVWIATIGRPALVLGSTQTPALVRTDVLAERGIDLVVRRSGGGAVLLTRASLWIDVILPRDDPLWDDDVNRSFRWLGEAWCEALAAVGVEATVHLGGLDRTPASRLVCFAGIGPGEVAVGGRKAVGLSQRRTRTSARFQGVVSVGSDPDAAAIVDLFGAVEPITTPAGRAALRHHLDATVASVDVDRAVLIAAFLAALA